MDTNGQTGRPCCVWSGPSIPVKGYEQNQKLLEAKKKLLQGEAPPECNSCVRSEANTGKSFRTLANNFHPHLTQEILSKDASYSSIRHVMVIGSNVCNLQCLPCETGSYKRSKELHDIGLVKIVPVLQTIPNIDDIAKSADIEQVTLCSGEPFYDKDSLRLLDLLVQSGRSRYIRLDINTNLSSISYGKINYLVENFSQVLIKGSIDGTQHAHEYLRYPSSWYEINQSVELLLSMSDVKFVITTALSNLSLLGYADLIRYFLDLGVKDFFITNVSRPKALHSNNLPLKCKQEILKKLVDIKTTPSISNRLVHCLEQCTYICQNDYSWDAKLLSDFLQKHDDFRDTNWRQIWPSLAEFC